MGGLGNQMFQYAAARALASRSGADLCIDAVSGFARDRIYRRSFELNRLPIQSGKAGRIRRLPFWLSRVTRRLGDTPVVPLRRSMYGDWLYESRLEYIGQLGAHVADRNCWMYGYWQTEQYFSEIADCIARELSPPVPESPVFRRMSDTIRSTSSVAVGIRTFEEMPGKSKAGVGGLVPLSFYEAASREIAEKIAEPTFFVFSTQSPDQVRQLAWPGEVHFITPEEGFRDSIDTLWLLSQCQCHILSNSSLYWWGAWLAERRHRHPRIIASTLFPNRDTVPARWHSRLRTTTG
jgi:hypothetical protein